MKSTDVLTVRRRINGKYFEVSMEYDTDAQKWDVGYYQWVRRTLNNELDMLDRAFRRLEVVIKQYEDKHAHES